MQPPRAHWAAISTIRRAAVLNSSMRIGEVARQVPFPGRAMPIASHRQFMLFAVNIPLHEPQPGQVLFSNSSTSEADIFPIWCWATA